jgi:hypothetical protein
MTLTRERVYRPRVSPDNRIREHTPIPDPDDEATCLCGLPVAGTNDRHLPAGTISAADADWARRAAGDHDP